MCIRDRPPEDHSVVVSELHTSKIWQMKLQFGIAMLNLAVEQDLGEEAEETLEDGSVIAVRRFLELGAMAKFAGALRENEAKSVVKTRSKRQIGQLLDAMAVCGAEGEDGVVRMERGNPESDGIKAWSFMWNKIVTHNNAEHEENVLEEEDKCGDKNPEFGNAAEVGPRGGGGGGGDVENKFKSKKSLFTSATAAFKEKVASAKKG